MRMEISRRKGSTVILLQADQVDHVEDDDASSIVHLLLLLISLSYYITLSYTQSA